MLGLEPHNRTGISWSRDSLDSMGRWNLTSTMLAQRPGLERRNGFRSSNPQIYLALDPCNCFPSFYSLKLCTTTSLAAGNSWQIQFRWLYPHVISPKKPSKGEHIHTLIGQASIILASWLAESRVSWMYTAECCLSVMCGGRGITAAQLPQSACSYNFLGC
jgi:hypothetical protein